MTGIHELVNLFPEKIQFWKAVYKYAFVEIA